MVLEAPDNMRLSFRHGCGSHFREACSFHVRANRPERTYAACHVKKNRFIEHVDGLMDLETVRVLKSLNRASSALATLKGQARTIPNQGILIVTLALQEAKASSEVENIVTMQELASEDVV